MACVSGRSAAEARRLVGVGGIAYAGSHGAELLEPGGTSPRVVPAFKSWEERVRRFAGERDTRELRLMRIRIEDKGPITAFHWRGVPDEEAALAWLQGLAQEAETAGLAIHWGRKVLEVRPPVPDRQGPRRARSGGRAGPAHRALRRRRRNRPRRLRRARPPEGGGALDAAVRVGVRSDEGPAAIVERADVVVDGVDGFTTVLAALAAD